MKKMIFLMLLISANWLSAQDLTWEKDLTWEISDTMFHPLAGGSAVIKEGKIYLSGGYSKELQDQVTWLQEYDPESKITVHIADMKTPRYGHVSLVIDKSIYFAGGVHDSTEANSTLEEWNYLTSDTTDLVTADSNFNRIFTTGVADDSLIYLIGGSAFSEKDTNVLPYIIEYDLSSDSVLYELTKEEFASEFPEQQMATIYGDEIFIFGGVLNGVLQSILRFNIRTRSLDTLDIRLIEPRAGGIAVQKRLSSEIYIIGGFNEGNTAMKTVEIFRIDGDDYTIEPGPELNEARKNLMAVSKVDGELIAFGGYNENGEVLSTIELLGREVTSINDDQKPSLFTLEQNYPNPFNPETTIKYSLPAVETGYDQTLQVIMVLYDILGHEVALIVNEKQRSGNYEVNFNAGDLASGIYFYRMQVYTAGGTSKFIQTKKMAILK